MASTEHLFEPSADTPEREAIRDGVRAVCDRFDDEYWSQKDQSGDFPFEFSQAIAEGGWLGIAMPPEYGGAGLGITEAAIMMQTVGSSAGTFAAGATHTANAISVTATAACTAGQSVLLIGGSGGTGTIKISAEY